MQRRDFVWFAGVVAALSKAAQAQPAKPVIGFLSAVSPGPFEQRMAAFHRGLGDTGYEAGSNLIIESRWAEEHYDRLPMLASELVGLRVDVLVTYTDAAALAAKAATTTIPIVFINGGDPVRTRIVPRLDRPGGNVTGASFFGVDLAPKQLSLLHELVPKATKVGFLVDQNVPDAVAQVPSMQGMARHLGLQLIVLPIRQTGDIDAAFVNFAHERVDALVVGTGALLTNRRKQIVALAANSMLPAIYPFREFVIDGGLISYGNSVPETFRQGGVYAGRILKGAAPANLPVVLSTKYETMLNLKTAKTLGITVSPLMLNAADDVIE